MQIVEDWFEKRCTHQLSELLVHTFGLLDVCDLVRLHFTHSRFHKVLTVHASYLWILKCCE